MENSGEQAHHKNTRQNIKAATKLTMKRGEQAHHQNEKASKLTTVKSQALNHDTWDLDL